MGAAITGERIEVLDVIAGKTVYAVEQVIEGIPQVICTVGVSEHVLRGPGDLDEIPFRLTEVTSEGIELEGYVIDWSKSQNKPDGVYSVTLAQKTDCAVIRQTSADLFDAVDKVSEILTQTLRYVEFDAEQPVLHTYQLGTDYALEFEGSGSSQHNSKVKWIGNTMPVTEVLTLSMAIGGGEEASLFYHRGVDWDYAFDVNDVPSFVWLIESHPNVGVLTPVHTPTQYHILYTKEITLSMTRTADVQPIAASRIYQLVTVDGVASGLHWSFVAYEHFDAYGTQLRPGGVTLDLDGNYLVAGGHRKVLELGLDFIVEDGKIKLLNEALDGTKMLVDYQYKIREAMS